jgi:hypothetical protein
VSNPQLVLRATKQSLIRPHERRCSDIQHRRPWAVEVTHETSCTAARGLLQTFFTKSSCAAQTYPGGTLRSCVLGNYICQQFVAPVEAPVCSDGDIVVSAFRIHRR